ncbi:MAG: N-acyl-D-amino-acid deacylase family protein [Gaiellaceae bacterium]
MTFDVVIVGGTVVDGSGAPPFAGDIGVAGGKIAAVGDLTTAEAALHVDASGLHVSPGFVDAHVHSELILLETPIERASLHQGVTTHIVGQDGFGFGPGNASTVDFNTRYLRPIYGNPERPFGADGIDGFLGRYERASTVNVATLVPNGNLRHDLLANAARVPTGGELRSMQDSCVRAMEEGAVGLSSGLDYTPSGFATTDELAAMAQAASHRGGVYVSHVRYRLGLMHALAEAVEIGLRANCPVHISHLRGDPAKGASTEAILELLDDAGDHGVDVTFDSYPYLYGCTFLAYLLPLWVREGNEGDVLGRISDNDVRDRIRTEIGAELDGWRDITIAGELASERSDLIGKDVLAAAEEAHADPIDFLCDLLAAERMDVMLLGVPSNHPAAEQGMAQLLGDRRHVFGSDGIFRHGLVHPRAYGGCARFVGRLTRDGALPLEEAVRHATSAPAERFGLARRGRILTGYAADLVVFDAQHLEDASTRDQPHRVADGVRDVWVNGVAALRDGAPSGAAPGRALRRDGR